MEDTFIEILTDMLALLEMGHSVKPTSVFYSEFKNFMLSGCISKEELNRKIEEFKNDGIEIKPTSFCSVGCCEEQLQKALELIELYHMEIRNFPGIPSGFCQGSLFKERLKELGLEV